MKTALFIIILFVIPINVFSRNSGETEITTEEGIEVFQNEKFYLLKKNVKIESDTFTLFGDKVKIFFDKDLYDIKIIDAVGNVKLESSVYNLYAFGESLVFKVENEEIFIEGINSELITNETSMFSDGIIKVNNSNGKFLINGKNSRMNTQDIFIEGKEIDGIFSTTTEVKDITLLNVYDKEVSYIKTENTDMYANKVKYNKENSLIELENNVKIVRDGETITGDYGTLDTDSNSYKVKSKNSKKVKVIIVENDQ